MTLIQLSPETVVVAKQEHVTCTLEGESVILHLEDGIYYGLNEVGARVWELVQQPSRIADIRDQLVEEFDVEPDRCESDLLGLLDEMNRKALIQAPAQPLEASTIAKR